MEIWLVHSHHGIGNKPWDAHGIKLQSEDVEGGFEVWYHAGGSTSSDENQIRMERTLRRSQNETSYNVALSALAGIEMGGGMAVISFKWPHEAALSTGKKWRLLTPKRVWLAVYRNGREVFTLPRTFVGQGPCYSFLDCLEGDDWRPFFEQHLNRKAA